VLFSKRVLPTRLTDSGFRHTDTDLGTAFDQILGAST